MYFFQLVVVLVALHLSGAQQFSCMQRSNGYYADPNSICSQLYWSCVDGTAQIMFCQDGLAYSAVNGTCVNTWLMPACSQLPVGLPFDCEGKPDGNYPNNASICSPISGYRCQGGIQTSTRYCYATARFDVVSQHCLFARHLTACGGNNILLPSDHLPPPVVPRELQYDCLKKVGNFPDPEKPCSNLFVICGPGGFPSVGVCPVGTVYDADFDWCNYPQYVIACGGHPPTTAAPSNTTTSSTTTTAAPSAPPPSTFNCTGLAVGYYPNPAAACSNIFYACTGGKWGVPEMCAVGTFFDPVLLNCNYRDNIPQCGGTPPTTTTTTATTTTMTTTTTAAPSAPPPSTFNCTGLAVGYYPNPAAACSNIFYACTGGKWGVPETCAVGTFFDPVLHNCNYRDSIPECGGTPPTTTTTTAATTTTTLPGGTSPQPIAFNCTGLPARNYPDPTMACSRNFITCTLAGTAVIQTCSLNTWYDATADQCLFYTQVPACSGTPATTLASTTQPTTTQSVTTPTTTLPHGSQPSTTQSVTTPTTTVKPFSCVGKQERNYPPYACADFFYECANGVAFKFKCPPGLKYDEFSDQCLRETEVFGCPKYIPSSTFCATKTVTGFYPYPGQCSSFVFCSDGIEALLSCPSGSVFNTRTNRCELSTLVSPPCGTGPNPAPLTCGTTTPMTTTTTSTPGRRRRWTSAGAIRSSETDCSVYISCSSSDSSTSGMISRCPEGFAFNPRTANCTPAYDVPDGVCFPPAQASLSKFCADLPHGIYAFPGNCRRALICVQKRAYLFYCWDSAAPYYDPIARKCSQATISCTANMPL